jgi:6-phosphofructokinase
VGFKKISYKYILTFMKTAGILINGGEIPSPNAAFYHIRNALHKREYGKIYFFNKGYGGLIKGDYMDITSAPIDPDMGITFLNSLKDMPIAKDYEEYQKNPDLWDAKYRGSVNTINETDMDLLVVIGGDGTLVGTRRYIERLNAEGDAKDLNVLCFPMTIENDIKTKTIHNYKGDELITSVCPGFPSAAENIIEFAWRLRTTAYSTKRGFTLEAVGKDAGWVALATALGSAEHCVIPEYDFSKEAEMRLYDLCADDYRKSEHLVVGVSEGVRFDGHQYKQHGYGKKRLGGTGDIIARGGWVYDRNGSNIYRRKIKGLEWGLNKRNNLMKTLHKKGFEGDESAAMEEPLEVRCQRADYSLLIVNSNDYDKKLAMVLSERLAYMEKNGEFGSFPVLREVVPADDLCFDVTKSMSLSSTGNMSLPIQHYYDTQKLKASNAYEDFITKLVDLENSHGRKK